MLIDSICQSFTSKRKDVPSRQSLAITNSRPLVAYLSSKRKKAHTSCILPPLLCKCGAVGLLAVVFCLNSHLRVNDLISTNPVRVYQRRYERAELSPPHHGPCSRRPLSLRNPLDSTVPPEIWCWQTPSAVLDFPRYKWREKHSWRILKFATNPWLTLD